MPITKTVTCPWCAALTTNPEKHQEWHANTTIPASLTMLAVEEHTGSTIPRPPYTVDQKVS
jgi:hypothetical protein